MRLWPRRGEFKFPLNHYGCFLSFYMHNGEVIRTGAYDEPIAIAVKRLLVTIGYIDYYVISYPTVDTQFNHEFPHNGGGTPTMQVMVPCSNVKMIRIQAVPRIP